ncbi:hypothetical protein N7539_008895 [Penicillium diatomitis]|uniref:Uncharacterized protein n=1 Tax=Penicillium diatomitis TaxID=2819901 RepID=A0A9W9WLB1_9EURO|nr:uncharacterized protein N7539_008895 [Penicillium diatomitis]KAJ5469277.1 hypothetical protein N7539_008895 [Penicillium diatomitis]
MAWEWQLSWRTGKNQIPGNVFSPVGVDHIVPGLGLLNHLAKNGREEHWISGTEDIVVLGQWHI